MKAVVQCVIIVWGLLHGFSPCWQGNSGQALAQSISEVYPSRSSVELPVYRLDRSVSPFSGQDDHLPCRYTRIRLTPVKILGYDVFFPLTGKALPRLSRTFDQKTHLPQQTRPPIPTGMFVELESAYGSYHTLIGRLQHGTQFTGAHYAINGHWESTDGDHNRGHEGNLAAYLKCDAEISPSSTISLESSYFRSNLALPQLPGSQNHQKSAFQATGGYQSTIDPTWNASLDLSWEHAQFTDQSDVTFQLDSYGGHLTLKQLWSPRNMASLQATGHWEALSQDQTHLEQRYYGTAILANSFALPNSFSVDAGMRLDYYHSEDLASTDSHVVPIATTRFHLFQDTSLYMTYHPRLKFPRFTDLYVRKLYTTVNPTLRAEHQQHYFESGVKQRFGDTLTANAGVFYHNSTNFMMQIDANNDHILEYEQVDSVDLVGIKASIQLSYSEQFVQDMTYTYTKHNIFSEQRIDYIGEEFRNEILTYLPNHQVQTSLYWRMPIGLTLELNGTYVSEQYRNRDLAQGLIGKRFFINVDLTQHVTKYLQVFLLGRNLADASTYDIIPLLDSEEITSSRLIIGGVRLRL